jgi:hypothetical protein
MVRSSFPPAESDPVELIDQPLPRIVDEKTLALQVM